MSADDQLAHTLKIQFGLAPHEPTAIQLATIKAAVARVLDSGRSPTNQDWRTAVSAACPTLGQYRYAGIDNSDLNVLLALATQAAGGRG